MRRILVGDPAFEDPMPDQAAEPGIVSGGRLGAEGHGGDAAEGGEQQESLHPLTSLESTMVAPWPANLSRSPAGRP